MNTWRFTYGENHETGKLLASEVEADTIFDALVAFHAIYSDARLDIDGVGHSRFDQLTHLEITRVD